MVLIKHSIQPVGTPGLGLPPSHRATDVAGKREVFRPKPLPLQVVGSSQMLQIVITEGENPMKQFLP